MILRQFKETLMEDCSYIYIYVQIFIENFQPKDVCYNFFLIIILWQKIAWTTIVLQKTITSFLVAIFFWSTNVVHAIVCHDKLNCESFLIAHFEH